MLWTVFGECLKYLRLFLYIAKSLETVVVQWTQACIFFVNTRHVGVKSAPLRLKAVPFGAAFKLHSAPLLLLSNSNPLRWASSWLLVHDDRLHLFHRNQQEKSAFAHLQQNLRRGYAFAYPLLRFLSHNPPPTPIESSPHF